MDIESKSTKENNKIINLIRFMIDDQMFDKEFILTAVLEYIKNNKNEEEKNGR